MNRTKTVLSAILVVLMVTTALFVQTQAATVTPKLKGLNYYKNGTNYNAKLTWHSKKGYTYKIYRGKSGAFKEIAKKKATGSITDYVDSNIGANQEYVYTVKQVSPSKASQYDKNGLKLLSSTTIKASYQNSRTVLTWSKVAGANSYRVYRIREKTGKRYRIGTTYDTSFVDMYHKRYASYKDILHVGAFIDPTIKDFKYNVRPFYTTKVGGTKKISKGLMMPDSIFELQPPVIVSLNGSTLRWSAVPNTHHYTIMARSGASDRWKAIKTVAHKKNVITLQTTIPNVNKNMYYAVQAVAYINGKTVSSEIDTNFTLRNARYSSKGILFIGDSIMYGTPYRAANNRHIFSIPSRIGQLTGATIYNPSIPGATYSYRDPSTAKMRRYRLVTQLVPQLYRGELPGNYSVLDTAKNSKGKANTKLADYDVVVLAAGTNDYADGIKLGTIKSTDKQTFYGSMNTIMKYLEDASKARTAKGKPKLKIVFVDLFYSERIGYEKPEMLKRQNRDVTVNEQGLTLNAYRNALNTVADTWGKKGTLTIYKYKTRDTNIVNHNNIIYLTTDNLHYTKYSYALYGNSLSTFLINNVL